MGPVALECKITTGVVLAHAHPLQKLPEVSCYSHPHPLPPGLIKAEGKVQSWPLSLAVATAILHSSIKPFVIMLIDSFYRQKFALVMFTSILWGLGLSVCPKKSCFPSFFLVSHADRQQSFISGYFGIAPSAIGPQLTTRLFSYFSMISNLVTSAGPPKSQVLWWFPTCQPYLGHIQAACVPWIKRHGSSCDNDQGTFCTSKEPSAWHAKQADISRLEFSRNRRQFFWKSPASLGANVYAVSCFHTPPSVTRMIDRLYL